MMMQNRLFTVTMMLLLYAAAGSATAASLQAPPVAPENVVVTGIADDQIRVTWEHSGSGVARFVIYRGRSVGGTFSRVTATPAVRRNYIDVDLSPNTQYCYRIDAENDEGRASSDVVCAGTLPPRPVAPTGLSVTQISQAPFFALSWRHDKAGDEDISYVIYRRRTAIDVLAFPIDTVSALSYVESKARNGIEYCFAVSALSSSGESDRTAPACATAQLVNAALPVNIKASAPTGREVILEWQLPVFSYETLLIERAEGQEGTYEELVTIETLELSFTDTAVEPDKEYCYRLQAANELSTSDYSEPVCAATPFVMPNTPVIIAVNPQEDASLLVVWSGQELSRHWFSVMRTNPDGSAESVADSITGLQFTDANLEELSTYCYSVRAFNPMFSTPASNELCARTGLTDPTDVTNLIVAPASTNPTSALTATWQPAGPELYTSYELAYRTGDKEWQAAGNTEETSALIAGLDDAVLYDVRVTAVRTLDTLFASAEGVVYSSYTHMALWPGDTDGDGAVRAADVVAMTRPEVFGQTTPLATGGTDVSWRMHAVPVGDADPTVLRSDADRNGRIEIFDFLGIAANAGKEVSSATDTPTSLNLVNSEHAAVFRSVYEQFSPEPGNEAQITLKEEMGKVLARFAGASLPDRLSLSRNYPNPFNPSTAIDFALPSDAHVSLRVYNSLGQLTAVLLDREMSAGRHRYKVHAGDWPSGLYVYVLNASGLSLSRTMTLIR